MGNRVIAAKLLKEKKRKRKLPRYLRMDVVKGNSFNPHAPGAEIFKRPFDAPDASVMERDVSKSVAWDAPIMRNFPFLFKGKSVRSWDDLLFEEFKLFCARHNVRVQRHTELNKEGRVIRRSISLWGIPFKDVLPTEVKRRTFIAHLEASEGEGTRLRPEFYEPNLGTEMVHGTGAHEMLQPTLDNEGYSIVQTPERLMFQEWRNWKSQGKTFFVRQNVVDRSDMILDLWFYGKKVYWIEINPVTKRGKVSMNYRSVERAMYEFNSESIRWVEYDIPIETS